MSKYYKMNIMKGGTKMRKIKIMVSLFLIFALPIASFAVPPRNGGSGANPPAHHGSHSGHPGPRPGPSHHGHHSHHSNYHGYYYDTSDAFWTFLGFSALTAIAVAASTSSKKKKEKVVVVEEKYEEPEEDLTITAEQQAQLQKLFDENKDYIAKLRSEKDVKTTALEQEKNKANPNEATIATLENEISQLSMNIFRVSQNTKKQIQTILTPAQYEAYEDMKL